MPAANPRCDGLRPKCSNCTRRGRSPCVYSERRDAAHNAFELLDLLKSVPGDQALKLLWSLRDTSDIASVLSGFKDAGVESSSARLELESQLSMKYPNVYPALEQIAPSVLAASNLLQSDYNNLSGGEDVLRDMRPAQVSRSDTDRSATTPVDAGSAVGHSGSRRSVAQATDYIDKRLQSLDIGFWTDVSVPNDFAARVVSLYLMTDHPLLGLFDPDHFVADLVGQRYDFCSRFLVSSLMYLGCQMYSAFDKSAADVAEDFSEEAQSLWDIEKAHDSVLTAAGAVLLSLSLMGHGKDHSVLLYAEEAAEMMIRLGFFGDDAEKRLDAERTQGRKTTVCYAAWGVFNWKTLLSLFYRQPGACGPMESLPRVPIPGDHGSTPNVTPSTGEALIGQTFPVLCNFWKIIHGALWIYYPDSNGPPDRFKLDIAELKFRELIAWADGLPSTLWRRDDSPHHVAVFHIWFHAAVLDIFRPFIKKPVEQRPRLKTFIAWDSSPDTVYGASVNQLKRLVFDYRTNYETSAYSILWHTGLLYLANAMLDSEDPQLRSYFLLCVYGYERLKRPYRVSKVIVRGLLSMMLRDTDMTGEEARKIMTELGGGWVTRDIDEKIRATFMVDLNLAAKDPEQAKVENMADEFDNMALFQDFLEQDRMET
ncbi:hypothetical protein M426DRAFT_159274 [Hypoxylon sp. CI-4A]|nr:hypothetical protein M426DRAFT_159274 [Hypoxylon sp. CI-4A]